MAPRKSQSRRDFVEDLIARWGDTYPDDVWRTDNYWSTADLPGPSERDFRDGRQIYTNPLWLLNNGLGTEATLVESFQHGDLNPDNVLVGAGEFRLIDMEKRASPLPALTPCGCLCGFLGSQGAAFRPAL